MPQFDPEWFASQIFWLVVTFGLLYLLLSRIAIPRIAEVMEERQDKVEDDLTKAEKLRNEAEDILAEYEKTLAEAQSESQKVVRAAEQEIAQHAAERHEAFGKDLAKRTREAEERIDKAKSEALKGLRSMAGEVAQAATAKLIGVEVDAKQAEKAVAEATEGRES